MAADDAITPEVPPMDHPPFIRNWRDQEPANSHGSVGWKVLAERSENKPYEIAPLVGLRLLTFRMLQAGMVEPAHSHAA